MTKARYLVALVAASLLVMGCGYRASTAEQTWQALLGGSPGREGACTALRALTPPSRARLAAVFELQLAACDVEGRLGQLEAGSVAVEDILPLVEQVLVLEAGGGTGAPLAGSWLQQANARSTHLLLLALEETSPQSVCGTPPAERGAERCGSLAHLDEATKELCASLDLRCLLEKLRREASGVTIADACMTHEPGFAGTAYHDAFFEWACSLPPAADWPFGQRAPCVRGIHSSDLDGQVKSDCIGGIVAPLIEDLTSEARGASARRALRWMAGQLDEEAISSIERRARRGGSWTHTTSRRPPGLHCTDYTRDSTPKAYWAAKTLTDIGAPRIEPEVLARAERVIDRKSHKTWRTTDPGWI